MSEQLLPTVRPSCCSDRFSCPRAPYRRSWVLTMTSRRLHVAFNLKNSWSRCHPIIVVSCVVVDVVAVAVVGVVIIKDVARKV